jgi:hypothetical protein
MLCYEMFYVQQQKKKPRAKTLQKWTYLLKSFKIGCWQKSLQNFQMSNMQCTKKTKIKAIVQKFCGQPNPNKKKTFKVLWNVHLL